MASGTSSGQPAETESADASDIPRYHHALMSSLNRLYNALISMRYISSSDLHYPPHPDLDTTRLASLGYELGGIDLLKYLPFLKNTEHQSAGPQLDVETCGLNYLNVDQLDESRSPLGRQTPDIEPWCFSLTDAGRYETCYIYDTRSRTIRLLGSLEDEASHVTQLPARAAGEALDELTNRFMTFELVPWELGHCYHLEPFCPGLVIEPEVVTVREMYLARGWPENFDGDGFERDMKAWVEERQRVDEDLARAEWRRREIATAPVGVTPTSKSTLL